MSNIAAIDAGSNAIRMVVGQVDDDWNVKPLENIRLPVRLGQDVFHKGYLEEQTIRRAEQAFRWFKLVADKYNVQTLRAVATSAAREAANSSLLLDRISRASGIDLELITAEEEARLIHQAVIHALQLKGKRTLLIDIGGGSVEVTTSTGQNIISTDSYTLGTVRLLQKLEAEEIRQDALSRLIQQYTEAALNRKEQDNDGEKVQVCVGTGGNVEEIGRLRQKFFKRGSDHLVTLDELKELIWRISGLSYEERIQKWKLRPDRADVILPASIVLYMIARTAGVKRVLIPNVGLKDGVLLDIAAQLSRRPRPQRRVQVWQSALHMGRRFGFDEQHAHLTARLAVRLFEQSKTLHQLSEDHLVLLEASALLHDIGHLVNPVDHEIHGFYLLMANRLTGLTIREQRIVANLIRYHRKQNPSTDDENFKSLSPQDRNIVSKLSALLRLAYSTDINHDQLVSDVRLSQNGSGWCIQVQMGGQTDSMLTNWALESRKQLFEEVFAVSLRVD
jgi:exopolyphosphatase/guanosine-5'-triphosphate,3'-diphosphate pyrophosphatase